MQSGQWPVRVQTWFSCMHMSSIWGGPTPDETESIATIHEALDSAINFVNTGDFYGADHNEMLIGKAIRGRRDDAFISVKFGAIFHNGKWLKMDLRPIAIKNFINYSLTRLGIETIDLCQPSRMDNSVLVRKANAVYPISALEIGYSLAERGIESELLPATKELGFTVIAFAGTGKGLLSGELKAQFLENDYFNHFA